MIDFPKCVIVIVGAGSSKPKDPDWKKDGSIWFVTDQRQLDERIVTARSQLAAALYNEENDDGEEWCEIVWSTTHYVVDDFTPDKHPEIYSALMKSGN